MAIPKPRYPKAFFRALPLLLAWQAFGGDPPLLICLPGGQPPARIDSVMGKAVHPRKVISFLHMTDLEATLSAYPGAPLIISAAYIPYMSGYDVLLKGRKGAGRQKRYLIISPNPEVDGAGVASRKVGMVDFLGREKIAVFVRDAFGFPIAKLKRVSKKEDLLSLLGMEAVDAVIIGEDELAGLQAETRLRLSVVVASKPMDSFPVLAVRGQAAYGDLKKSLMAQPKSVLQSINIEGWE